MIPNVEYALKANFSPQDTGVLQEFVALLFETAIVQWFQGALVALFGVGLAVCLVMESFFPEMAGDLTFSTRFAQVTTLVGFMYFIWVNRNMNGSAAGLQAYREFLNKVKGIAIVLSGVRPDDKEEQAQQARQRDLLRFLVFLVDDMVRPGGSALDEKDFPLPADYRRRVNLLGGPRAKAKRFDLALSCLTENIPAGPAAHLVTDKMNALCQQAEKTETGALVREPIVFEVSVVLFLIFWWLIYTPASMWVQFGTLHTLWAYPLVMAVIAAPGIFRMWVGSPWNPMRPVRIAEHERWPREFADFIAVLFEDRDKGAADLLSNFEAVSVRG